MKVQWSEIYGICITQEENVFLYPSLVIFPLPIFSTESPKPNLHVSMVSLLGVGHIP